jgi:hypothetical protein
LCVLSAARFLIPDIAQKAIAGLKRMSARKLTDDGKAGDGNSTPPPIWPFKGF